jgi:uncharacterized membrane protein YagU involved in acid resistance
LEEIVMRKIWAIVLGGAAAGFLDHMSALATYVPRGVSVLSIQQYQASAVIGPAAFSGGWATAFLGLGVHFSLTTLMAGIFVLAAQKFPVLLRYPWCSGPVYGVLIYFVMTYIAVPLTAVANWKPAQGWALVAGLLAHCFYVGLPIASIARVFLADLAAFAPATANLQQLGCFQRNSTENSR